MITLKREGKETFVSLNFKENAAAFVSPREIKSTNSTTDTKVVVQETVFELKDSECPDRFTVFCEIESMQGNNKAFVIKDHKTKSIFISPDMSMVDMNSLGGNTMECTTIAKVSGTMSTDPIAVAPVSFMSAIGTLELPHLFGLQSNHDLQVDRLIFNPLTNLGLVKDVIGPNCTMTTQAIIPTAPGGFEFVRRQAHGDSIFYIAYKGM